MASTGARGPSARPGRAQPCLAVPTWVTASCRRRTSAVAIWTSDLVVDRGRDGHEQRGHGQDDADVFDRALPALHAQEMRVTATGDGSEHSESLPFVPASWRAVV